MNASRDPADPPTDEELLARLRRGEHDLFGLLVRRHERELYGYLRRYTGDPELAADVFQNTCVAVFTKIQQYEPGRAARPWLYAIATNQAIDAMRRRARRKDAKSVPLLPAADDNPDATASLFDLLERAGPGPDAIAEGEELRRLVRTAVDELPDLLRQVVVLTYFQGMKYQDAADVLGVPLGTVKSRLHAALVKLTECWHKLVPGDDGDSARVSVATNAGRS